MVKITRKFLWIGSGIFAAVFTFVVLLNIMEFQDQWEKEATLSALKPGVSAPLSTSVSTPPNSLSEDTPMLGASYVVDRESGMMHAWDIGAESAPAEPIPASLMKSLSINKDTWSDGELSVVPVPGRPGVYYVGSSANERSEGWAGFSNRIYLMDLAKKEVTLLYEENDKNLSPKDYRADVKDILLLATQGNRLILRYHVIGTGGICDTLWDDTENVSYLDLSQIQEGTKKFEVPNVLSTEAKEKMEQCAKDL